MIKELCRLLLGLAMIGFHRQIATFMFSREQQLVEVLTRRGWRVPAFSSERSARDLYFLLGVFVCVVALVQLYSAL